VIDHLVAGIEQGPERQVYCFGDTDGDDDFVVRVVFHDKVLLDIFRDRSAKARRAEIRGVAGLTLLE
jgi:hypothetical protein